MIINPTIQIAFCPFLKICLVSYTTELKESLTGRESEGHFSIPRREKIEFSIPRIAKYFLPWRKKN